MRRSYHFVRHGRAVYQERGFRMSDHPRDTDWPLAPFGHVQACSVAPPLLAVGVERVVSSSLARARQTARNLASESELPYEHAWSELNELSPRRLKEGARLVGPDWLEGWAMARAMRRHVAGLPTPGWRVAEVETRVREVLARLDALDEAHVAVVGHGFWILMLAVVLGGPLTPRWIDNCSVTRVDADGEGRYRLVAFARRTSMSEGRA